MVIFDACFSVQTADVILYLVYRFSLDLVLC